MVSLITIPKVQTQDRNTNQLQNNANTAVGQLSSQINQINIIGEIKLSTLTLDQFQRQGGPGWVFCNGANCVGSTYNKITGNLVVPTIADLDGAHYFVRIN
jgi:hypothetical protein